jgi:hypothetical protein
MSSQTPESSSATGNSPQDPSLMDALPRDELPVTSPRNLDVKELHGRVTFFGMTLGLIGTVSGLLGPEFVMERIWHIRGFDVFQAGIGFFCFCIGTVTIMNLYKMIMLRMARKTLGNPKKWEPDRWGPPGTRWLKGIVLAIYLGSIQSVACLMFVSMLLLSAVGISKFILCMSPWYVEHGGVFAGIIMGGIGGSALGVLLHYLEFFLWPSTIESFCHLATKARRRLFNR